MRPLSQKVLLPDEFNIPPKGKSKCITLIDQDFPPCEPAAHTGVAVITDETVYMFNKTLSFIPVHR